MASQYQETREVARLREENRRLRELLRELRLVLITRKHKQLIDQELRT